MEAGNSLATASRLIVGNTLLVTECRLLLLLLLLLLAAAAVAGRRSAWATAVLMLDQQRTYTRINSSCSNSQETKTRKQLMAHAELCCDS